MAVAGGEARIRRGGARAPCPRSSRPIAWAWGVEPYPLRAPFPALAAAPRAAAIPAARSAMSAVATPISARQERQPRRSLRPELRRARAGLAGRVQVRPAPDQAVLPGSLCTAADFEALLESQLISRHLDLMARVLRVKAGVLHHRPRATRAMPWARLTRHTDPAFLHYRSGGFMAERFRKLPGMDPIMDSALSFAASRRTPSPAAATGVGFQAAVGAAADLHHRLAPAAGALGTAIAIEQGGASVTPCRSRIPSPSAPSATLPATTPPRRRPSTPPPGPPTRSCPRRCCSFARTTASASR